MTNKIYIALPILFLFLLTGCLYPESEKVQNNVPVDLHITSVEQAIALYQKETGVYPILNSTIDTPIYEKYRIDMNKLYPRYLAYLPANAFENGGTNLYVIVDIETSPKVRLIDLNTSSKVENIQRLVNEYTLKKGEIPAGEKNALYVYNIDYNKLKADKPNIISPFTGRALPLLLTSTGEVFVDYTLDIGIFMNQGYSYHGNDARDVLVQNSFFVPVKSLKYEFANGELKLAEK